MCAENPAVLHAYAASTLPLAASTAPFFVLLRQDLSMQLLTDLALLGKPGWPWICSDLCLYFLGARIKVLCHNSGLGFLFCCCFYYLFIYYYVSMGAWWREGGGLLCLSQCRWRSEDYILVLVLFYFFVGLEHWTQLTKLAQQMSLPVEPSCWPTV